MQFSLTVSPPLRASHLLDVRAERGSGRGLRVHTVFVRAEAPGEEPPHAELAVRRHIPG